MSSFNLSGMIISIIVIILVVFVIRAIIKPRKKLQQKVDRLEKEVSDFKKNN